MRLLAPLAALAIAAAGCNVKTEGAPCTGPDQCPTGQECGFDRKCSEAATHCGAICYADDCDPAGRGTPKQCQPATNGICSALEAQAECSAGLGEWCGVVGGIADCLAVSITFPGSGALVGESGTTVTAKLVYHRSELRTPASLSLATGTGATALGSPSGNGTEVSYTGNYVPPGATEGTVDLVASVASTPALSPAVTVSVDARRPDIQGLLAVCGASPCVRDDVLTVSANVTDTHLQPPVEVTLDLDGGAQRVSMTPGAGSSYSAPINLRQWPFDALSRDVVVHVTARDTYSNVATANATLAGVSRARPAHDTATGVAVTSPAVESSGIAVFGVAASTGQLRGLNPDGTAAWSPTTLEITSGQGQSLKTAPSVGGANVFAGSEDGRVYRVGLDGAIPSGLARWPSTTDTSAVPFNSLYTPIINVLSADHAYSAGGGSALYQFYSNQSTATLPLPNAVYGPGAFAGANPFFATSDGTGATLRRFVDTVLAPVESSSIALTDQAIPCDKVQVPLAVDGSGSVIAACNNGQVHRVANAASLADDLLYKLPAGASPTGSPVVQADGGILIPTSDGNLRRIIPGTPTRVDWTTSVRDAPGNGEFAVGVVAADATSGAPAIYATTNQGRLVALDGSGAVRWSGLVDPAGPVLGFPSIAPIPGGAPASALPTLYAGSSTGKLFRVVVDSGLDTAAPWPKAHHDVRNTGSSTSPLP